jgi:predicted nucleic-acid-binding Zn-ribbon protein
MTDQKCLNCGSTTLQNGELTHYGKRGSLRFKSDTASFMAFRRIVSATTCKVCGHVQLSTAPEERIK